MKEINAVLYSNITNNNKQSVLDLCCKYGFQFFCEPSTDTMLIFTNIDAYQEALEEHTPSSLYPLTYQSLSDYRDVVVKIDLSYVEAITHSFTFKCVSDREEE